MHMYTKRFKCTCIPLALAPIQKLPLVTVPAQAHLRHAGNHQPASLQNPRCIFCSSSCHKQPGSPAKP